MKFKNILASYAGFSSSTWRLVTAGFINSMGLVIIIFISLYLNSINFSVKQIGILLSMFGIAGLIGGYWGGILTDSFSAMKICKISLVLNIIPLLLFPLSQSFLFLLAMAFLLGVTSNIFRPAYILALTCNENKSDMERIIALRRVAINLGSAFGAALFGFIAAHNYSMVFFIDALITGIAYFILKDINANEKKESDKNESQPQEVINNTVFFYFILLLMFLVLLVFNQNDAIYPLYLTRDLELNLKTISWVFAFSGILIALFQLPITARLQNLNTYKVCAVGALLIGLGFSLLPICHSLLLIYLSCVIWTLGEMIFFPALLVLVLNLAGNKKGKRIGMYQFIYSLSTFTAPALGTLIYSYEKNLFWYLSGIIGLFVSISFLVTNTKSEKTSPTPLPNLANKEA